MGFIEKHSLKKILQISLWVLLASGMIALLVAALYKKQATRCKGMEVKIAGETQHFFLDKNDVSAVINQICGNKLVGSPLKELDLMKMEKELKKDPWVKKAELYFDKDGVLIASIEEKNPAARVFCMSGNSFYIDEQLSMLPLSDRHTARLPMFTGFPSDLKVLQKKDSLLLADIYQLSRKISKDTFLMAMVDQVNINSGRKFELIPKMGDQLIVFGDMENADVKLGKLKLFYSKVLSKKGFSKYKKVDLQYHDQIVATVRNAADVVADSVKTMQLIKMLAEIAERKAGDTTQNMVADNDKNSVDVAFINQSLQREELEDQTIEKELPKGANSTQPINNKPSTPSNKPSNPKQVNNKPSNPNQSNHKTTNNKQ